MNDSYYAFAFLGVFAVIVVAVIITIVIKQKKENERKQEIDDYCKKNNLIYSESAKNIPSGAKNFKLINIEGRNYYAEMSGVQGDYHFSIFDYIYETNTRKSHQEHSFTICVLSCDNIKMPQFFARDENSIIDTLGELFGGQDIDYDEDPTFSDKFVLQGKSEPLVREFFNSKVRASFVKNHKEAYQYEGDQDCLMISVPERLSLKERLVLLGDTVNIFNDIRTSK
ncbi:MAG: hypothetical protein IKO19_13565 [Candidatus Riflebacteria bacterium]|nr:hypothetical protein [Candidatus Riflebacteria bacterium]